MDPKLEKTIRDYWSNPLPAVKARDVEANLDSEMISDIVGPRRAGKTYLMFREIARLTERIPKEATIYVNFENRRLVPVKGALFNDLIELIQAERLLEKHRKVYLFLDEVQRIPDWERYVRSIQDEFKGRIKIFVTGSTARLIEPEVRKLLTGRHMTSLVLPLSFREYLGFSGIGVSTATEEGEALVKKGLEAYLAHGGYPEVVQSRDKEATLAQLYSDAVAKDVLPRVGSRGAATMSEFSDYLFSNVGNMLSFGKMSRYFKSVGTPVSVPTLIRYFGHLRDAFLLFDVTIHSVRIRDRMQYPRKVYGCDTGMAGVVAEIGEGRLYENAVAVELLRRGIPMNYWKNRAGHEVDFIVGRTRKSHALQVCSDISDETVRKREYRALSHCIRELDIPEATVVTRDAESSEEIAGRPVRLVPLWKWLLEGVR